MGVPNRGLTWPDTERTVHVLRLLQRQWLLFGPRDDGVGSEVVVPLALLRGAIADALHLCGCRGREQALVARLELGRSGLAVDARFGPWFAPKIVVIAS